MSTAGADGWKEWWRTAAEKPPYLSGHSACRNTARDCYTEKYYGEDDISHRTLTVSQWHWQWVNVTAILTSVSPERTSNSEIRLCPSRRSSYRSVTRRSACVGTKKNQMWQWFTHNICWVYLVHLLTSIGDFYCIGFGDGINGIHCANPCEKFGWMRCPNCLHYTFFISIRKHFKLRLLTKNTLHGSGMHSREQSVTTELSFLTNDEWEKYRLEGFEKKKVHWWA